MNKFYPKGRNLSIYELQQSMLKRKQEVRSILYKYSHIMERPLISVEKGMNLGTIKDLLLSADKKKIAGLLSARKDYTRNYNVVYIDDVLKLGEDAVIVNSASSVRKLGKGALRKSKKNGIRIEDKENTEYFRAGDLIGIKVFSKDGDDLGVIDDMLINWDTCRIESFVLSEGLYQDLVIGKKRLPLIGMYEFGEDTIVVEKEAKEEMEDSGGGIKNRFFGKK